MVDSIEKLIVAYQSKLSGEDLKVFKQMPRNEQLSIAMVKINQATPSDLGALSNLAPDKQKPAPKTDAVIPFKTKSDEGLGLVVERVGFDKIDDVVTTYKKGVDPNKVPEQPPAGTVAKEAPKTTRYVVQLGETIEELVKKSLKAQGAETPDENQLKEAVKIFKEENKAIIRTNKRGTYLLAGQEAILKGEVDTSGNKTAQEINDELSNKYKSKGVAPKAEVKTPSVKKEAAHPEKAVKAPPTKATTPPAAAVNTPPVKTTTPPAAAGNTPPAKATTPPAAAGNTPPAKATTPTEKVVKVPSNIKIERDADGSTKETTYDAKGYEIKSVYKDPQGKVTDSIEYINDAKGKTLKEVYKDSQGKVTESVEYTRDENGNKLKEARRDSQGKITGSVEYTRDANGETLKEVWKDSQGKISESIEFTRDANGKKLKEVYKDSQGKITSAYDGEGNEIKTTKTVGIKKADLEAAGVKIMPNSKFTRGLDGNLVQEYQDAGQIKRKETYDKGYKLIKRENSYQNGDLRTEVFENGVRKETILKTKKSETRFVYNKEGKLDRTERTADGKKYLYDVKKKMFVEIRPQTDPAHFQNAMKNRAQAILKASQRLGTDEDTFMQNITRNFVNVEGKSQWESLTKEEYLAIDKYIKQLNLTTPQGYKKNGLKDWIESEFDLKDKDSMNNRIMKRVYDEIVQYGL